MAGRHRLKKKKLIWPRLVVGILCISAVAGAIVWSNRASDSPLHRNPVDVTEQPTAAPSTAVVETTTAPAPPSIEDAPTAAVPTPPPVVPEEQVQKQPAETTPQTTDTETTAAPPPKAETTPQTPEAEPATSYPTSGFGGVKPFVAVVGHLIKLLFDVAVGGVGHRSRASDHPLGYALDFMVGSDRAKGDKIAACVLSHEKAWHVNYVIWRQRINYGNGWEAMKDRGSVTENHYDHVHVSFDHGKLALPLALTC
jgi:hypothetical protein